MLKLGELFGKKDASKEPEKPMPFRIMTEFIPYKLYFNRKGTVSLHIRLKNLTGEPLMSSLIIELPKQLGFGEIGLTKEKEIRLGVLSPNEERESHIEVSGDNVTDKGEYTIAVTALAHYRDYGHILNAVRKRISLNVV
jgi:uncharacterized membrane protein